MVCLALIFSNCGPYHLARLDGLHKYCTQIGWHAVGIELSRFEKEYPWRAEIKGLNFPVIPVIANQPTEQVKFSYLLLQLHSVLSQVNPDVLAISGYANPAMLSALVWCLWHGRPAILLSESKEDDVTRSWWQETFKTQIVKRYKAALVGGQPHKRYLMKLGMAPEAIFLGYDVVGNEVLHPDKIRYLPQAVDKPYFLSINRFIPKKNLFFILSSYAAYRHAAGTNAWNLVLCGNGELRPQIEQHITELDIQNFVHLPGFLQQDKLLPYFAHASCFVHASIQEQWGLVVNEAMAAALPVLVSNRCGCFEDLVVEGVNGFGFDPENPQQLTDLMLKMSSGEIDLKEMGQAALKHIQKYSPDYFAQGLMQAVEYALAH